MRPSLAFLLLIGYWMAPATFGQDGAGPASFPLLAGFDELVTRSSPNSIAGATQLLDVRPRVDYEEGHIEGSIWADIKQAEAIASRPGGLTDRAAWIGWTTPLGLNPGSNIRVIGDNKQLDAARAWWLLRYLGVERVGLVDGNFSLWKAQRRPITRQPTSVEPHPFPVDFQARRLATRDDVRAALAGRTHRIADARTIEEWTGRRMLSKRGGHMPDACRIEWSTLVDAEGRFLPLDELRAKVGAAGIRPGEAVIAHCQGGGRASVDAFALELLGHPTRNYYLSWSDWGNAEDTPITTADGPAPEPANSPRTGEPAGKPFAVEYYYKCRWGQADEFLTLFKRNHLPILRERMKQGDILSISMTKPRIHTGEADRWDFRVTLVFKDAAQAFNIAADDPIKQRLFPDQAAYKAEERRRFAILESHTDLPVEAVDLDAPANAP